MKNSKRIKVAMFYAGGIFPVSQGCERVIYEIARYLNSYKSIKLTLILLGEERLEFKDDYAAICDNVVWINRPSRWSFWATLNKIVSRLGIDILKTWCLSREIKDDFCDAVKGADKIILNYAEWFSLLPKTVRKRNAFVITHDIGFYRRASFKGNHTLLKRFLLRINRVSELAVLRTFNKIGVFADYEEELLIKENIAKKSIVSLGMPISANSNHRDKGRFKYDFVFLGGSSYQNEEGVRYFFARVAPLLKNSNYKFALVGGISNSNVIDRLTIPGNFNVVRLGYVEDVGSVLQQCKIGVGTLPYGSGVKVKVVESIMHGLPMVLTETGAEGIPITEDGCVVVDKVSQNYILNKIQSWLTDLDVLVSVGEAQGEIVRSAFSPQVCLRGMASWIEQMPVE